ncbi:MAG: peptide deformylase [Pseudomonadota bacterium]
MTILPIITLPDKRLRQQSAAVEKVTPELLKLADDMLETMYDAPGIGLAAVQIGQMIRLIVLDIGTKTGDGKNPMIFFNPEVTWVSEEKSTYNEGCLSIPAFEEDVIRPASIKISYMDKDGKQQAMDADGILATCLQHEIDHINGKLFIDYISSLKRALVTKKFIKKQERRQRPSND